MYSAPHLNGTQHCTLQHTFTVHSPVHCTTPVRYTALYTAPHLHFTQHCTLQHTCTVHSPVQCTTPERYTAQYTAPHHARYTALYTAPHHAQYTSQYTTPQIALSAHTSASFTRPLHCCTTALLHQCTVESLYKSLAAFCTTAHLHYCTTEILLHCTPARCHDVTITAGVTVSNDRQPCPTAPLIHCTIVPLHSCSTAPLHPCTPALCGAVRRASHHPSSRANLPRHCCVLRPVWWGPER